MSNIQVKIDSYFRELALIISGLKNEDIDKFHWKMEYDLPNDKSKTGLGISILLDPKENSRFPKLSERCHNHFEFVPSSILAGYGEYKFDAVIHKEVKQIERLKDVIG